MRVRFFGSPDCKACMEVFVLLNKFQIDYDYIDATEEDDDIQDFCDQYDVGELPHIQFITDKNVVISHIGALKEEELMSYLIDYFPDSEE